MRLGTLLLIVLLVAGGYFLFQPWWMFLSLRDAARTGDQPALNRMIDYDSVRQGLNAQIEGEPSPPPAPSVWSDPVGAIKHMFAPPPVASPQTEVWVTARAIAAMADGRRPGETPLPAGQHEPLPGIEFFNVDRFTIKVTNLKTQTKNLFVFERKGLFSWKLERIVLPSRKVPAAPAKPASA